MSICVATDQELLDLCEQTLAWHGKQNRDGVAWAKITNLFGAIRIAQHAAYAHSHGEPIALAPLEFPTSPTPKAILRRIAAKDLYEGLGNLRYNVVDRHGNVWLPEEMNRLLHFLEKETAAKAAGFNY